MSSPFGHRLPGTVPRQRRPLAGGNQRGFTLAELAIVAAILVVVSAISFPRLLRFNEEQKLRQSAIELKAHLERARTLAQRLQGACSLSLSNASGLPVTPTPATSFSGTNVCRLDHLTSVDQTRLNLSTLNLAQVANVRGLTLSSTVTPASGSATSSTCPSGTPCTAVFNNLGLMANNRLQTFYLGGTVPTSQYCVELSLTLIRLGFRNNSTDACTYNRS